MQISLSGVVDRVGKCLLENSAYIGLYIHLQAISIYFSNWNRYLKAFNCISTNVPMI